jgi:hypothetical protein
MGPREMNRRLRDTADPIGHIGDTRCPLRLVVCVYGVPFHHDYFKSGLSGVGDFGHARTRIQKGLALVT